VQRTLCLRRQRAFVCGAAAELRQESGMKKKAQVRGLSLLQLMFVLGVLGIVAWLALNYLAR